MIVYFADRSMKVVGHAGTRLRNGFVITGDSLEDTVESGAKTLTFDLNYTARNHAKAKEICEAGNYVFYGKDEAAAYTVVDTEDDSELRQINVYCEDAGLDMISGIVGEYHASGKLQKHLQTVLNGTGFEIGDCPDTESKSIDWTDDNTVVERLLDLADRFEMEMNYSYAFDNMKVAHRYVNYYARRGTDRSYTLRLGKEVSRIVEKKSVESLATALLATGGTPDGSSDSISLSGMTYDDGDIYLSGGVLYSRSAKARWQKTSTRDILREYTDESLTAQTLLEHTIKALKSASEIETTYEIEVTGFQKPIDVGDTVKIVDAEGKLYLQSRVQKVSISESDGTKELELGETVELNRTEGRRVTTGGSGGIASSDSFTTFGAAGTATALSTTETTVKNTLTGSTDFYEKTETTITLKNAGRYMISVNGDFTGTGNVTVKVKKGTEEIQSSTGYVSGSGSVPFMFIDTFSANDVISLTETCEDAQTVSDSGNTVLYIQRLA